MTSRLAAALLLAAATLAANAQRLPTNARPEHYSLHLTPDLKAATFTGEETIDITLATPSTTTTLNAAEIIFGTVRARCRSNSVIVDPVITKHGPAPSFSLDVSSSAQDVQTGTVTLDDAKAQATFTFEKPLSEFCTIGVTYTGILNDKLRGFYLSKTKTRNYAVTQFESTDARRAFPSFDEPGLKATFDISLTVDKGDTVISNTNQISDKKSGEKHTLTFATTPKMSTYLVAFLVGDFKCSKGNSDGTPIRVCSTPDKVKLTKFALNEARQTLHYYNDYFGTRYPMPKLDMVAIPDFEAGAMENFGCITYRETGLLVDNKLGSVDAKKGVTVDVTHEMAHQWFGDMVTMQWWDNLWLNEGFATWMEAKAAQHFHPDWRFDEDTAQTLDGVLTSDSRATTRTIRATADTTAEIEEMFDGITYEKGGAVIGMVENFLGEETFRLGVHNYLQAHLYANATAEDFWNAQTATSGKPVDRIMEGFVAQPGVPLVRIGTLKGTSLPVSITRFQTTHTGAPSQAAWTLPICFKTSASEQCALVAPDTNLIGATSFTPPLFVNAAAKGYFRTDYTPEQTAAIIAGVETRLTPEERINFLGDRWALVTSGTGSVADYLDLVFALKADPNSNVLDTAVGKIEAIDERIATPADSARLHAILRKQFGPIYSALGGPIKHESTDRMHQRALVFNILGFAQDPAVQQKSIDLTTSLFTGKGATDEALNDAAIAITARNGTPAFYDAMQRVSANSTSPTLSAETLQLLADFQDPALVTRTLDYTVSGQVRNQDSWQLLAAELRHPETRTQAWAYIQSNWDKVHAQLTPASGQRVVAATGSFCTTQQRDQVQTFFQTHKIENAERALKQAYDASTDCIHLHETQQQNLTHWLDAHS